MPPRRGIDSDRTPPVEEPKIAVSFIALFFAVYLLVAYLVVRRRRAAGKGWVLVATSTVSALIAITLDLTLALCALWGPVGLWMDPLALVRDWLQGIAHLSLLAALLIPIWQTIKGPGQTKPASFNLLLVGSVAVLWICTLSIAVALDAHANPDYYSKALALLIFVQRGLVTARDTATVLAVSGASFAMLRKRARRQHLQNRVATATILALALCQLGDALLELIYSLTLNHFSELVDVVTLLSVPLFFAPSAWFWSPWMPFSLLAIMLSSYLLFGGAIISALYAITSPEVSFDLVESARYEPVADAPPSLDAA
ncbi:hypothetical protein BDV10DRAFT_182787 [Aspergillus recurvatus]